MDSTKLNRKGGVIPAILGLWAFVLIVFHALLVSFRYVIDYTEFTAGERWAGLGLVAAAAVYGVVSFCVSKEARNRLKQSFRRLCSFEMVALTCLLVWFAVSCAVNQAVSQWRHLKIADWYLFDAAVCIFLFFPMMQTGEELSRKRAFEILVHAVVISYTVFTIVSLWHIFQLEDLVYPSGEEGGFTAETQLMLGYHYNLTGMIAATMFCLCFYMILTQGAAVRVIYAVFAFVHLAVIYLSNSRTVFVGVLAFVTVFSFFLPWKLLKRKKAAVRWTAGVLICAVSVLLTWYGRTWAFVVFEKATHFSEELAREMNAAGTYGQVLLSGHGKAVYRAGALAADGAESVRGLTNLNYRDDVWKAALKVMVSSPKNFFFGVTYFDVPKAIWEIGGYHREEVAHAHNIILQIGVGMGVPAMLMFVSFLVSVAVRCVRILVGRTGRSMQAAFWLPASVLCFVVINMAESYLFGYYSVIACFFFLLCGWIVSLDRDHSKQRL